MATLAVAYLPPQPPPPDRFLSQGWWNDPTPQGRRAARLGGDFIAARVRARTATLRDSLMRELSHQPPRADASIALMVSTPFSRQLNEIAARVSGAAYPKVPSPSREIRGALAFVFDTSRSGFGMPRVYTPTVTDGRTCLSVIPISAPRAGHVPSILPYSLRAENALGPCAFYVAFGHPGLHIERWLIARRFDVAMFPDWYVRPRTPLTQEPLTISWQLAVIAQRMGGQTPVDLEGEVYYGTPFSALRCADGEPAFCRRYLLSDTSTITTSSPEWVPGVVPLVSWWDDSPNFLPTLVREMGPERFGRFWRSPLPPDSAFHQAFGVSFDEWAPTWARLRSGYVRRVTTPGVRETLATLVWSGIFACGCMAFALLRRVA